MRLSAADTLEGRPQIFNLQLRESEREVLTHYFARHFQTHTPSRIVQRALFLCPARINVDRRHFFAICLGPECCRKTGAETHYIRLQFIIVFFVVLCNGSHCVVFTFSILLSNNLVNYKIHETLCTQPQVGTSISDALVLLPLFRKRLRRQAASVLKRCHSSCRTVQRSPGPLTLTG